MPYAYQTEQGQDAIRRRNKTAEFYACVNGLNLCIDSNPLSPLAISFHKDGRLHELAIVRNRNESLSQFQWPSVMITSNKLDFMVERARRLNVRASVIVGMADYATAVWTVVNEHGEVSEYPRRSSSTKGDCMGSHFAVRENSHLPIEKAKMLQPTCLL